MTPPRLTTSRLILRAFAPDDWEAIAALLVDGEAMQHMHFRFWTETQRREWFDEIVANTTDSFEWVIEQKGAGEVVGWFGIGTSDSPTTAYDISFGYALMRTHWGHGYMTEAMKAVFAYQFEVLEVPQLNAVCGVDNPASARVMEKCGMRRVHADQGADFEGNWSHRHHYAIRREEYNALSAMASERGLTEDEGG
jgi:RimJ/RimL family protein N-acetyltransferase